MIPELRWSRSNRIEIFAVVIGLFVLGLFVRLPSLDAMVNVDMFYLWAPRINRFWDALLSGDFASTYQTHHPGVTFMWLSGALLRLFLPAKGLLTTERLYLATLPIAVLGSVFPATTYLLLRRILSVTERNTAIFIGFLFATEPLLVGHSRNAHLDMLVTGLAWSSLLCAIITLRRHSVRYANITGVLLGLAILTKLSAAGYALGITLLFLIAIGSGRGNWLGLFRLLFRIATVASLSIVVFWPALWVSPLITVLKLYQGLVHEVDKTAAFMFLGQTGKLDLPPSIYYAFALFLATPEVVLPVVLFGTYLVIAPGQFRSLTWQLTLGTIPLAILIGRSSHVGARYLIPIMPWVITLAGFALVQGVRLLAHQVHSRFHAWAAIGAVCLLFSYRTVRLCELHPLPIAYCSTWHGIDCAKVFHLGWGEGLKEAAVYIETTQRHRFGTSPVVIYGSAYAPIMRLWTAVKSTSKLQEASLLIEYISDRQRNLAESQSIARFRESHPEPPLYEVVLQGRVYVRIFKGPMY